MRLAPVSAAILAAALVLTGCGGASTGSGSGGGGGGGGSNPPPPPPPALAVTTTSIPPAKVGTQYSAQLTASNGTAPLTWTVNGAFANGLGLSSSGLVSGTPTTASCSPLGVKVTDSSSPPQTAFGSISFTATSLSTNLIPGQVGVYYEGEAFLDCGTDPITWTLISGSLPAGIQLTPLKGQDTYLDFPGTPTQSGTFNLTIQAQDANFQFQTSATLTILPAALKLTDGLTQLAVVGQPFDHSVSVTGGAPPYTFSVYSGSLPAGLQLNTSTGEITGTPQSAGLSQFGLKLTDSSNSGLFTLFKPDSILVTPAPLPSRNDTIANATPISPGTYYASLSPYTDSSGNAAPDQDYYVISGVSAAETYEVNVAPGSPTWTGTLSNPVSSWVDPAIEFLDSSGHRLTTCNDPLADGPPTGAPFAAGAKNFTDACLNHSASGSQTTTSDLTIQTSSPNQTFYIHVFDFQGRARPDFTYTLTLTKK